MSRKSKYFEAADLAVAALMQGLSARPKVNDPRENISWIKLNQIYSMNLDNLQKATFGVMHAKEIQNSAIKVTNETRAQLDLLAIELGIDLEEGEE